MSRQESASSGRQSHASKEQLSRGVESARLGVWDWNIETGELLWTRECLEMFGVALDTAMSYERFMEAIYPEDREMVDQAVQAALKSGDEYSTEMRAVWPDGSVHWIASRGRAYFNKAGKAIRMSGAGMEITRFKETEEELRRARAEARNYAENMARVMDAIPAITFFSSDPEGRTMTAGRVAREVFGLPADVNVSLSSPEGQRFGFQWLEDGRVLAPEELPVQQAASTGREVRSRKFEVRFPDGRSLHLLGHAAPLLDASGKSRGSVGAFLDITEIQETEEQLRMARAEAKAQADNLSAVFDAMPAAAFLSLDRECKKVISNRAAYELLRLPYGANTSLSAMEVERPPITIFENGREVPDYELPLQKAAATGQAFRDKELEIRFTDGSSIHEFGHAVPLFDETGNVRGAIGAFMNITDRKVIEERLRASTERFQIALRGTPITVFNQGLDLHYKWIYNPVGAAHTVAEIIGKTDHEILERPEDAEMTERIKREVLRTGRSYQGEMAVMMNGAIRHYHVNIDPQRDPQGRICGLTCASFDLTERKRDEAEREKLARQLQHALDAAKLGRWYHDNRTGLLNWDDTFREIFGLSESSMPTEQILKFIHPDDVAQVWKGFKNSMNPVDPKPYTAEYRVVRPDGSMRWVEAYGTAEFAGEVAAKTATCCSGTVCDVTERKQAQEALRVSEDRYRKLFETMAEGLAVCELVRDETGKAVDIRWLACNSAHERLTGLSRDVLLGHCASETFPRQYKEWVHTYEKVVKDRTLHRFEQRSESGARVWDLTAFSYDGDQFAVLYEDITVRKQAEDALRSSEGRYRQLAETLEQEVEARTRELQERNQQILRTSEELKVLSSRLLQVQDEERRRIARDLHDSSGQILTVLGLDLASIAEQVRGPEFAAKAPQLSAKVEETQKLVDVLHRELRTTSYLLHPPLLDETGLNSAISWYVQGMSQRSGMGIDFEIAADLGRLSREMELLVFRLVQESLTNIHRHSGSKVASIRIARRPDAITVDIQDSGKGIPAEKLAAIRAGASGLGIRAMQERLLQFGGQLQIESGGGGTKVFVTIPLRQPSNSQNEHGIERVEAAM